MIYFTADTHFGHANIIRYCNRPFTGVHEMNLAITEAWNSLVESGDTVYVIGDFSFTNPQPYLEKLRGQKILIRGNHDSKKFDGHWSSVHDYLKIHHNKNEYILSHYAMRVWEHSYRGSMMLYGHSHNALESTPWGKSMDVGVDAIAARGLGYRPISIEEVTSILSTRSVRDIPSRENNAE
jgi:calcineurin-like phosphoesterase family protein